LSSKIDSKRIKLVNNKYYKDSFISDIENTRFINGFNHTSVIKNSAILNVNNKKVKTNYSNLDCKENLYMNIINNIIDKNKKCFKIRNNKIGGNMIICDRIHSSFCQKCNRVHEKENPFLIVNEAKKEIYFYCRRNKEPSIYSINLYLTDNNKIIENKNPESFDEVFRIYQNNILYKNKKINNIILFKFKNTIFFISPFLNMILNLNGHNLVSNDFSNDFYNFVFNKIYLQSVYLIKSNNNNMII
jgi:hypothetical protein